MWRHGLTTAGGHAFYLSGTTAARAVAQMRTLMLTTLLVSVVVTSGCFVSKKEIYSNQPVTQADCERAGGKWKSDQNRCDL
jgi:hypothetical protein